MNRLDIQCCYFFINIISCHHCYNVKTVMGTCLKDVYVQIAVIFQKLQLGVIAQKADPGEHGGHMIKDHRE